NARPRVWPSVARLLGHRFPSLRDRYQRLLFDPAARQAYLRGLRERVQTAARSAEVAGRLAGCP
ncbi:MAG TPA: hypothetical protein P5137_12275, partial [Candidatus Brocadiia bacterium]|nr:hypothetical protein [Candidatus Brocadiia bacterium]